MASPQLLARLAACSLFGATSLLLPAAALGATYKIDPAHSSLLFRVKHMNTSYIYGRFNEFSGTVNLDDASPSFNVQIRVDSIDSANAKRDQHLKGPDFFSARQFPTISFQSTRVAQLGPTTYDVEGTLTMHGVSKPIKIRVDRTGSGKGPTGAAITGLAANFTIKRTDFGMDYGLQGVADEVLVVAHFECAAQ